MRMLPSVMAGLSCLRSEAWRFEGNSQHQDVGGGAGGAVFHAGHFGSRPDFLLDGCGCLLRALFVARTDDDGFSGARPAQGESHARGAGASDDRDRADPGRLRLEVVVRAHANSASSGCSAVKSASFSGTLMWIRE